MKRTTKRNISSAVVAALIAIPIVILKIHADQKPEEGVRTPTKQEIESEIAKNTETEPVEIPTVGSTEITVVVEITTEVITVPETEPETDPPFAGYDFIPLDADLQVQIFTICEEYEISFDLVLAVIKTESNFHCDSIGDNGKAIGLMQIQPQWWQGTADEHGWNLYEPIGNVKLGVWILNKALNDNGGDMNKALKQYNSGDPNFKSDFYVNTVFEHYQWIEGEKNGG